MSSGRTTVLICEDEENLRELMRASLDPGYRFVEASTVAEADDVLRSIRRQPGEPIPVVVVSAWTTQDYRDAALEAGADAFVAKPFEPEQLSEVVSGLLRSGDP
jgi:two-component system phosphate regulon response regulator OmpR